MGTSVGDIDLDLRVNKKKFNNDVRGIQAGATKAFSSMSVAVGNIMANMATKAIQAVGGFVKDSINEGSRLSELENVTNTVFGNMASKVENFSKTALQTYGLNETQAKQMMGTYGAMAKAFGYSTKQTYDMSSALTGLTGDVASFYNLDIAEAGTKLKSVFTGETESLKELGVVMTQSALDQFALSNGFGKTTSQMTEQEKVALRLAFVQNSLSSASGDFARTTDSWANQTRILSGQFQSLKASLGQGFIAALTPVIKVINIIMGKLVALANTFKNFMEAIFGKKSSSGGASSETMTEIADATGTAADSTGDMADATGTVAKNAKEAKKMMMGIDEINANSSSDDSGSGGSGGASGGGAAIGGMGGMGAMEMPGIDTSAATTALTGFQDKVKSIIDTIKGYITEHAEFFSFALFGIVGHIAYLMATNEDFANRFGAAIQNISTQISNLVNNVFLPFVMFFLTQFIDPIINAIEVTLLPIFTELYIFIATTLGQIIEIVTLIITNLIEGIIKPCLVILRDIIIDVLEIIKAAWDKYGADIMAGVSTFMEGIKALWQKIYTDIIEPIIKPALQMIRDIWNTYLKDMVKQIVEFVGFVIDAGLDLLNGFILPFISWFVDKLKPAIDHVMKYIVPLVGGAFSAIKTIFDGVMNVIKGLINFIVGVFTGDWKRAWTGIVQVFTGIFGAIGGILKGIMNGVIGLINGAIGLVVGAINALINGSISLLNKIPGVDITWRAAFAPQIPYLAKGGIIDEPTLAMIGERGREAVVPLENNTGGLQMLAQMLSERMPALANAPDAGFDGDIILTIDGEVIGKVALRYLQKLRRQGATPLVAI